MFLIFFKKSSSLPLCKNLVYLFQHPSKWANDGVWGQTTSSYSFFVGIQIDGIYWIYGVVQLSLWYNYIYSISLKISHELICNHSPLQRVSLSEATIDLLSVSIKLPFLDILHKWNPTIVVFGAWPLSLSVMLFRFIYQYFIPLYD